MHKGTAFQKTVPWRYDAPILFSRYQNKLKTIVMIKTKKDLDRFISVPFNEMVNRLGSSVAYAKKTTGDSSAITVSGVLFKHGLPISLLRMDIKCMEERLKASFGMDKFGVIKEVMDKLFYIRDICRENAFNALIDQRVTFEVYSNILTKNDEAVNGLPIPIAP